MMKKTLFVLIMLIAAALTASAEIVRYNVRYQNEYGNTETTWYDVETRQIKECVEEMAFPVMLCYDYNEIIDEDSDAKDLAIVRKLDRQGYIDAVTKEYGYQTEYLKTNGAWHKLYGFWGE